MKKEKINKIILKTGALTMLTMLFLLVSCKVGRYFIYNFADLKDHEIFHNRPLTKSSRPFQFIPTNSNHAPKKIKDKKGEFQDFENYLEENKTVALMVIRNDSILYENYFKGYSQTDIVPSFSMAKSVLSILIGCAIEDGLINSVHDTVTTYIPEFNERGFDDVTIEHLLQMTSGLKFNEGYFNPFGKVATFYYGTRLRNATERLKTNRSAGEKFEYLSGNSQILGHILDKVLGDKTITEYLQEKIWTPIGMEYDASWSIDRKNNGIEKTFCCINARAKDFAKIGRLFLNKGNWNGEQLVPEKWVDKSTQVDEKNGSAWYYQYQWWLPSKKGDFMAIGILGQYIYVNPNKNLIIVRLGKKEGDINWWKLLLYLAEDFY